MTRLLSKVALSSILFVIISCSISSKVTLPVKKFTEIRYVMGTLLEITLHHSEEKAARQIQAEAFEIVEELDRILSNYKAGSELTLLNNSPEAVVSVSPTLYEFISLCIRFSLLSEGLFDPSVGPLMDLWHESAKKRALPSRAMIAATKENVGMKFISVLPENKIKRQRTQMKLDSGGIGKGYAVDKVVALLKARGITQAFINFGQSSIYALGSPSKSQGWEVLLRFSDSKPLGVLTLRDQAFSASDSMGQSFEIGDEKYSHIINPKTGIPLIERRQAVALGAFATEAEALTKYLVLQNLETLPDLKGWGDVALWYRKNNGKIISSLVLQIE